MEKKKFIVVALDSKYKTFIVHIAAIGVELDNEIYISKKVQKDYLKVDEASTKVFSNYTDFADVFSPKLAAKHPKHTRISNHSIKLVDNWQTL